MHDEEFETVWGARPEDDWVWRPGGDPGLRFTPYGEPPRPVEPELPLPDEVAATTYAATGITVRALVAACVAVFLLSTVVSVQIARHVRRAPRPTFAEQSLTPTTTAPVAPPSPPFPLTPATPTDPPAASAAPPASAAAARGVVDITTRLAFGSGSTAGTGMLLTDTGRVLTNNHVIAGTSSISVQVGGVGRAYSAKVVGTDAIDDVAVLQLADASGLPVVETVSSSTVHVGDAVTAVGNAFGQPGPPTVVSGVVRALNQGITVTEPATGDESELSGLIQTDAPLQPGDSGGPLLNASGKVVGMNTAASVGGRFRRTAQEGFAIPIDTALGIVNEIVAGHGSDRIQIGPPAFLGVNLQTDSTGGALLAGVQSGTPAARAGLAAGDTITSFDSKAVDSSATLRSLIKKHHPGDKVSVGWTDSGGKKHTTTVQLAEGPPA